MQDSTNPVAFICDLQDSDKSDSSQDNNKKTFDRQTQISEQSQTIQYKDEQDYKYKCEDSSSQKKQKNIANIKQITPEKVYVSPKRSKQDDNEEFTNQHKNSIGYKQSDRKLLDSYDQYEQRREQDIEENIKKQRAYRKVSQLTRQYQEEIIQKISNNSQQEFDSSQNSEYQEDQDQFQQQPKKQNMSKPEIQKIKSQPSVKFNIKQQPLYIEDQFDKVITKILPIGYKIVCTITIQSRFLGLSSKYNLNLKQNDGKNQYQFLLSAKKELMKINSNFIISKNYATKSIHKRDNNFVGLLDANFTGTQFTLHPSYSQQALIIINYGKNIMGHSGVRQLTVIKPKIGILSNPQNTLNNLILRKQNQKIERLQAAKPVKTKSGWKVDFKGKAKQASGKNFILKDKKQRETLLFAKQNDDTFLMEVTHPFSILQAFSICLSSLDSKLFCN